MRIGLLSDTHDQRERLTRALERFRLEQITTVLHAGDVTKAATLRLLADFDVWVARGNMDRDPLLLQTASTLFGRGRMAKVLRLSLDGARLALLHGDDVATLSTLIRSEQFDYVIHGHTHVARDERRGKTRILNPGALGHVYTRPPSCAILDLRSGDLTWVEL